MIPMSSVCSVFLQIRFMCFSKYVGSLNWMRAVSARCRIQVLAEASRVFALLLSGIASIRARVPLPLASYFCSKASCFALTGFSCVFFPSS
jgi:hypothetical protein